MTHNIGTPTLHNVHVQQWRWIAQLVQLASVMSFSQKVYVILLYSSLRKKKSFLWIRGGYRIWKRGGLKVKEYACAREREIFCHAQFLIKPHQFGICFKPYSQRESMSIERFSIEYYLTVSQTRVF